MLLLMLVAVDFGRLFFSYISVSNAAREATSYAAAHAADTPWDVTAYRAAAAGAGAQEPNAQGQGGEGAMTLSNPTCFDPQTSLTLNCHAASNFAAGIGNQVRVTASQPFTFMTPIIGDVLGGSLTLSASATAPILNPPDTVDPRGAGPVDRSNANADPDAQPYAFAFAHPDAPARRDADALAFTHTDAQPDADPDVHGARPEQHVLQRPGPPSVA